MLQASLTKQGLTGTKMFNATQTVGLYKEQQNRIQDWINNLDSGTLYMDTCLTFFLSHNGFVLYSLMQRIIICN